MKKRSILYLAFIIFLIALGPSWYFIYNRYIEPKLGTEEVVVAAATINRGDTITDDALTTKRIKTEDVTEGALLAKSDAINKEANYFIRKGQQIIPEMVEDKNLVPSENQSDTPIPNDWIYAYPQSVLRGDKISFYPVLSKKRQDLQPLTNVQLQKEVTNNPVSPVVNDVTVSYAKANNNTEVTSDTTRKKATSRVETIEVILTNQQLKTLADLSSQGYQFIISYK